MLADHGQHGEGEHHQRDVPVPAVPAAGLVVIEPELVLGGLEAVLDRPAASLDLDQRRYFGPGRAPGREEGELAVGDGTADQQAPRPQAGEAVAVLGGLEVGQLEVGPVASLAPLVPSPAESRAHADAGSARAISSAVPATGGLPPQELKG